MKANIGDKFIIEIDRIYSSKKHEASRYGVKGFSCLIFDDHGIELLQKFNNIEAYEREIFERGINAGAAIAAAHGSDATTQDIKEIKLGDEVEAWDTNEWVRFIASGDIGDGTIQGFDLEGGLFEYPKTSCRKTGKHYLILEQAADEL